MVPELSPEGVEPVGVCDVMGTISLVKSVWYPQRVEGRFVGGAIAPVAGPNEQATLLEAVEVGERAAITDRHPSREAALGDRAIDEAVSVGVAVGDDGDRGRDQFGLVPCGDLREGVVDECLVGGVQRRPMSTGTLSDALPVGCACGTGPPAVTVAVAELGEGRAVRVEPTHRSERTQAHIPEHPRRGRRRGRTVLTSGGVEDAPLLRGNRRTPPPGAWCLPLQLARTASSRSELVHLRGR